MDRPALRRILLDLIGTAHFPDLVVLDEVDWAKLSQMAAQHRLQPLLFGMHRDQVELPQSIRAEWQAAHRFAAMQALVQQAELVECCALLADFSPVALKGAWLATHAYPEPAQRPLRDLDLLVAPEAVIPAFETLQAAGYTLARTSEMALGDVVRLDKHMPPLIAPRGTVIELHHRLWERDGRLDHASPVRDEAAVRRRAVEAGGIRYPAPQDLLNHLIVHAVYGHRLDCGPLILADIDYLLRTAPVDWLQFWAEAVASGWRDGARLMLELTLSFRPDAEIDFSADPGTPAPADLLAVAPDLLLQDLDTRASAGFAAATLKGGSAGLAARVLGRSKVKGETAVTRDMSGEGGFLGWAGSRALRSLKDLAQADVRRQSRQLAALSKWLDR